MENYFTIYYMQLKEIFTEDDAKVYSSVLSEIHPEDVNIGEKLPHISKLHTRVLKLKIKEIAQKLKENR
jgi:hypothetical protein